MMQKCRRIVFYLVDSPFLRLLISHSCTKIRNRDFVPNFAGIIEDSIL